MSPGEVAEHPAGAVNEGGQVTAGAGVPGAVENKNLMADDKKAMLEEFVRSNEIPFYLSEHLDKLRGRDIVFIVDDSGSMGLGLREHSIPKREAKRILRATRMAEIRRWDELKFYLEKIVKLGLCFDEDGIDLVGLNRPKAEGVNNIQAVDKYFEEDPGGATPLYTRLREVLSSHEPGTKEIIVIATDGVPNDVPLSKFKSLVQNRKNPEETPIVFMVCSDNDRDVAYLNSLDHCPWVGVVDDYNSEKKEIKDPDMRMQYSPGAHVANVLLNWVPEIDALDDDNSMGGEICRRCQESFADASFLSFVAPIAAVGFFIFFLQ